MLYVQDRLKSLQYASRRPRFLIFSDVTDALRCRLAWRELRTSKVGPLTLYNQLCFVPWNQPGSHPSWSFCRACMSHRSTAEVRWSMNVCYMGRGDGSYESVCGASRIARNSTLCLYLSIDLSMTPIWFNTPDIPFHDFWTGRIEWRGQIFHMTHNRCTVYVIRNIVGNRVKSHTVPVFGTRLESENQVFRNAHTRFLRLSDVNFRVMKSNFSQDILLRRGPGHPKSSQILSNTLKHPQMLRVCAGFHQNIPRTIH